MPITIVRETAEDAIYLDCALTYHNTATITAVDKANPCKVYATNHGYSNGDRIFISEVVGMIELNNLSYYVANANTNDFTLQGQLSEDINSSSYTTYVSGGTCEKWAQTITGLDHLEGCEVAISAEGATHPNRTVVSGSITLQYSIKKAHVGIPYTSYLQTMDLEAGSQIGTSQGKRKRIHQLTVRLYKTTGCKIGSSTTDLEIIPFRDSGMNMDQAPDLFTGDKRASFPKGFDRSQRIMLASDQPLPFSVISIMPHIQTMDSA